MLIKLKSGEEHLNTDNENIIILEQFVLLQIENKEIKLNRKQALELARKLQEAFPNELTLG